jgi:hypothetical protein
MSIQVLSTEPWIPWEIIKPVVRRHTDGMIVREDKFLCEKFSFTRWIIGNNMPHRKKEALKKMIVVVPTNAELDSEAELKWIEDFAKSISLDEPKFVYSRDELVKLLRRGDFDLLHISTHGTYNNAFPLYSAVQLADQDFRPDDIYSINFGSSNPIVILSACRSARQGYAFGDINGWITSFLRCGCSSVVGTMWSVSDESAKLFTRELYHQLKMGTHLGEGVRLSRNVCKRKGDQSWLAYTVYGHPNVRPTFS